MRDVDELAAAFQLRTGVELGRERVAHIIDSLSQGLLLDDERFGAAYGQAVDHFRELPYRPLSHAGAVYPADPAELEEDIRQVSRRRGSAARRHGIPG